MSRTVTAGEQINLRAKFKDDYGDASVASGISLYIFESNVEEPFNLSNAYLTVNDPSYLGEGIYEYGFDVPDPALGGTWTDVWYGTLNMQVLSGIFNFTVSSGGEVESFGNQIFTNDLIEITLASGVMATDGTNLETDYVFEFMTTTAPSYTNIRKVKLEIGGYVADLDNITIQTAILEASLEADQLTFASERNTSLYEHARREWATCKVSFMLLDNVTSHALKSKSLGDLRVEYDTGAVVKSMMRIMDCLQKWEPQLLSGGYAKDAQQPMRVVKGESDWDRPAIGRLWSSTDSYLSDRFPAANTKSKDSSSYRFERIYRNRKKFW